MRNVRSQRFWLWRMFQLSLGVTFFLAIAATRVSLAHWTLVACPTVNVALLLAFTFGRRVANTQLKSDANTVWLHTAIAKTDIDHVAVLMTRRGPQLRCRTTAGVVDVALCAEEEAASVIEFFDLSPVERFRCRRTWPITTVLTWLSWLIFAIGLICITLMFAGRSLSRIPAEVVLGTSIVCALLSMGQNAVVFLGTDGLLIRSMFRLRSEFVAFAQIARVVDDAWSVTINLHGGCVRLTFPRVPFYRGESKSLATRINKVLAKDAAQVLDERLVRNEAATARIE